jgi:hypothetical protein
MPSRRSIAAAVVCLATAAVLEVSGAAGGAERRTLIAFRVIP